MPLTPAIDADLIQVAVAPDFAMACYRDDSGTGAPLVLVHSVNAAPSAMEMKPLFERFRGERPVYAPDLPGFGVSPRGDFDFSPAFFAEALAALLNEVAAAHGQAPDVVALSLAGEFAARAIVEIEAPCRSLVLISPTGVGRRQPPSPETGRRVSGVLGLPLLGTGLFRALTTRPSVRFFLNQAFSGRAPDELVEYALQTARQPDAHHGPFAFLAMGLFTPRAWETLYGRLPVPALVVYDTDPNIDFDCLPELLARNAGVSAERIAPSRGLPHWEHPERTADRLKQFWDEID